ncbi:DnaJ domain-containing protein [Conexibacter sp. W3-3-2]|uniref:J domain-containing protein n=1 Tax=Conexibacter sp. W3-3-2 TaxID=2675227 RepID=UPI0012B81CB7|nr:J domain-containing protein [Conexibacter sp. W3-3-2]MTD46942.1 DnaJ domain-containing protein [Conexibacter sp. W3-3-2]
MDPYAVLGLTADASDEDVARAYKELAKQWHPDLPGAGGAASHARMAQINAAYDAIRSAGEEPDRPAAPEPPRRRPAPGSWLSERMREALPPELLGALHPFEDVRLVARPSTWQSPQVVLAVTAGRLLWAPVHTFSPRVHVLRLADVAEVGHRVRRPLRRRAVVRLVTHAGRKLSFGDLEPDAAALIERNVADGMEPRAVRDDDDAQRATG